MRIQVSLPSRWTFVIFLLLPTLCKVPSGGHNVEGMSFTKDRNVQRMTISHGRASPGNVRDVMTGTFPDTSRGDVEALLTFKMGLKNSSSGLSSWKSTDVNACSWFAVKCDEFGRVTEVALTDQSLSGQVSISLFQLRYLEVLSLYSNRFSGSIPDGWEDCSYLRKLDLSYNNFSGKLPRSLRNCHRLELFNVDSNMFSGEVPSSLWGLPSLQVLLLSNCRFEGHLSNAISKSLQLSYLSVENNSFSGSIPSKIGKLENLGVIRLHFNKLTGKIPDNIGELQKLINLELQNNRLTGHIPKFTKSLILYKIDLSNNDLSGSIPTSISLLPKLRTINVSNNVKLTGSVPETGIFESPLPTSFLNDVRLCGKSTSRTCEEVANNPLLKTKFPTRDIIAIACTIGGTLVLALILWHGGVARACRFDSSRLGLRLANWLRNGKQGNAYLLSGCASLPFASTRPKWMFKLKQPPIMGVANTDGGKITSHNLFVATDGFNADNILGTGDSCTVYKGKLSNGTDVAVKVFNAAAVQRGASCNLEEKYMALTSIRHENIVKILGITLRDDFTLILECMPNGSLEQRLYNAKEPFSWERRLKTAMRVARALSYLHLHFPDTGVYCDLDASHILFDCNMEAHLTGLRLPGFTASEACTITVWNGYKPPGSIVECLQAELLMERASTPEGDVFSFGILLIELLSGRKPADVLLNEGLTLAHWVQQSLQYPELGVQIFDSILLQTMCIDQELVAVMDLALVCTNESPGDRPELQDIISKLQSIQGVPNTNPL